MLYPFIFHPIFKDRIWGGRNLERLYGKKLPGTAPIGESWEISDRPGDESIIANGPLAGKSIRWLMENHRQEFLGRAKLAASGRFPLLIKILDAQEKLSLQVHPPAAKAAELGGEPKTEMWYVADATPEADLYVGLRKGVTQGEFEQKIKAGTVEECFHRIQVRKGDVMFLPSGRVHALGAGSVIFEIQQNSDTTYRVFDWNRVDSAGKPRELHVEQSLASIDFQDFEPSLVKTAFTSAGEGRVRELVNDPLFRVELVQLSTGKQMRSDGCMTIVGVLKGSLRAQDGSGHLPLNAGDFCLVPASCKDVEFTAVGDAEFLKTVPGE
jgi:mannose-6-phosphate isomerase